MTIFGSNPGIVRNYFYVPSGNWDCIDRKSSPGERQEVPSFHSHWQYPALLELSFIHIV